MWPWISSCQSIRLLAGNVVLRLATLTRHPALSPALILIIFSWVSLLWPREYKVFEWWGKTLVQSRQLRRSLWWARWVRSIYQYEGISPEKICRSYDLICSTGWCPRGQVCLKTCGIDDSGSLTPMRTSNVPTTSYDLSSSFTPQETITSKSTTKGTISTTGETTSGVQTRLAMLPHSQQWLLCLVVGWV